MDKQKVAGTLNAIARQELSGRRYRLGEEAPCPHCGATLMLVPSYDFELYLITGRLQKRGRTWIHLTPAAAMACRKALSKTL